MRKIEKNTGSVYFGNDSWKTLQQTIDKQGASSVAILVDNNTKTHCLPLFEANITFKKKPYIIEMQAGETHKNIHSCLSIWEKLSQKGFDRSALLINLGGGVVTDLGGFIASTYMRGITCINIPTSLLAMVDAAVGGKNGIDLGALKNQIGIIRDPLAVVVDTMFLQTMPEKQITSGLAEMLKHGLIYSNKYWEQLENFDVTNISETESLVWESIVIKNEVVTEDQQETGRRKTLNFGHTLGHAIESYCLENSDMPTLLHGEAIAIGMILALHISVKQEGFSKETFNIATQRLLEVCGKVSFSKEAISEIIKLLKHDKKNVSGKVLFVLLSDIGKPLINKTVDEKLILKSFEVINAL
ncbi:3-dehydroquinate synthase [unidentified eubacterium SCB49]|nr:3-dehydroquinate synthase [unidentified eubacterium SCB49]